jgi:alpha-mannosidase
VTLRKGARFVEVTTTFDNRCRDHRLRVAFPTGLNVEKCHAESAFDVVEREVERGAETPWVGGWNTSSPQQRFVDVSDGRRGLSILNEGLREYEVSEDPGRTVYVTLMRAYEIALSTVAWKWERHPEMELSQCPGKHEFTYAIMPHAGTWDGAKVHLEAERLNVPMAVAQVGKHGGSLPKSWGLMELVPGDLLLSCVKLAEGGGDLVVRVYNPTGRDVDGTLRLSVPVSRAARTDMEENPSGELEIDGGSIPVTLGPKKVETLKIGLGKSV